MALHPLAQPGQALKRLDDEEAHAPQYVRPRGAVPEAGQAPDHEHVEQQPPDRLDPAAAEREVQVIAKPRAQRDVPPAPELRDRLGDEREVEVLQKVEAEHPAEADRHVRIAAEVVVHLHQIGARSDPRADDRELAGLQFKRRVDQQAHLVGQYGLLAEAHHEALAAEHEVRQVLAPVHDLVRDRLIPDDRARDQLWEKRYVQADVDEVFLHPAVAAIDVDDVAHRLEGEERDADRQRDLGNRQVEPNSQLTKIDNSITNTNCGSPHA